MWNCCSGAARKPSRIGEHEQIIAAIEKGDADAAEEALVIHLKRSAILYALSNQKEQA